MGKQDRSVETEATDRLQRDLRRPFGVEAEIEKPCGLVITRCGSPLRD
jgi:hypothetical protein